MTFRWLRLLLVPGIAWLTSACSLFDGGTSDPTPKSAATVVASAAPATPTPAATPEPLKAGDSVPLTWREVSPPAMEGELPRPLERLVAELDEAPEDLWRVLTVDGDAAPRVEYETHRWVLGVSWMDGGAALYVPYFTKLESAESLSPGVLKLKPGAAESAWDLRARDAVSGWRDGGMYALVADAEGDGLSLLRSDGTLWKPQSDELPLHIATLSLNGRYVVLEPGAEPGGRRGSKLNLVAEPLGDSAIVAGQALFRGWSPDTSRLALLEDRDLTIFDVQRGDSVSTTLPVEVPFGAPLTWSSDGTQLIVNDGVLDVATLTWRLEPSATQIIGAALSPDGNRLLVTVDPIFEEPRPCGDGALVNQTLLFDLRTASKEALFDCDRFFAAVEWVDDDHFIAYTHSCWACEGRSRLFLASVADTSTIALTDEFANWVSFALSPEGTQVLVSGEELRIYSPHGVLLRSIPVESGYAVTAVAWKPDGTGFAYVVGPKNFLVL